MPRMLNHGPNRLKTIAANRSSSWNARHFLHLFAQSTKPTVLRLLTELLFKDVDAKVDTPSQICTFGPAISLLTSFCVLLQNEHRKTFDPPRKIAHIVQQPNQDYLVPYRTAFLLYITVRTAVTWTAFTMGDEDL